MHDPAIAACLRLPGAPHEKRIEHRLRDWQNDRYPVPDSVCKYVTDLVKHSGNEEYLQVKLYRTAKRVIQEEDRFDAINERLGELQRTAEKRRRRANGGWPVLQVEPPLDEQTGHLAKVRQQLHWWRTNSLHMRRELDYFGVELTRQSSKPESQ